MKGLLDYIPGNSFLHKMNPISKLLVALCLCITAFISSSYFFLILLICINILLSFLGNINYDKIINFKIIFKFDGNGLFIRVLGLFKGLLKISVFLFVLQVLLIRSGEPVIKITNSFYFTDKGFNNGFILLLRLISATLPLSIMISVTNISDLSNTLIKYCHLPYKYVFTFTTAIRFIPVFASELSFIMDAQNSRGVEFNVKNPIKKLALILPLCIPLLVSSVRRIDSVSISTELRGFHLRNSNSCSKSYSISFIDITMIVFSIALIVLSILF